MMCNFIWGIQEEKRVLFHVPSTFKRIAKT